MERPGRPRGVKPVTYDFFAVVGQSCLWNAWSARVVFGTNGHCSSHSSCRKLCSASRTSTGSGRADSNVIACSFARL